MTARRLSLLAAVVAGVVALSVLLLTLLPGVLPRDGGSGVALIGGPFELVDQTGRAVTAQAWTGKPLLIYFGYTYCPDVCPTELSAMSAALDLLGDSVDLQPLFITVDPARDTVAVMADYVGHFHPKMIGLTGSAEQVAVAAKAYRVYYAKGPGEGDGYLMDHSGFVYLMGPDHRYLAHFPPSTAPEAMAKRIRELL
jgi:protein SCO1/2